MAQLRLHVQGLRCQSCAQSLEKHLLQQPGISRAEISFAEEWARIEYSAESASPEAIEAAIRQHGYAPWSWQESIPAAAFPWREALLALVALPFLLSMPAMLLGWHHLLPALLQAGLAGAAWLLAWPTHRAALRALRQARGNMDALISLGSSVVLFHSLYAWWRGEALYFETTAIMLAVVAWGRYLEKRMKRQHFHALHLLQALLPQRVQRWRDGQLESIAWRDIRPGDALQLRAGERVAADGEIIDGQGSLHEAHLNGEALPRSVQVGDAVLAGALLQHGRFNYRVTALGAQSYLGQIMQAMDGNGVQDTELGRLADRISAYFLPAVLAVALLSGLGAYAYGLGAGEALLRTVSVLLIACPCALGLATPTAFMAALAAARRRGLWFADAAAMERAAQIDALVLDKTGTLTRGEAQLLNLWTAPGIDAGQALALATALERSVHHPYAQAFAAPLEALPELDKVEYVPGCGLEALYGGQKVRLGRLDWVGMVAPDDWQARWQNATWMALKVDAQDWALFAVDDAPRPEAAEFVAAAGQSLALHVLSGDRPEKVALLVQELGLKRFRGQVQPEGKADYIRDLQRQGLRVAMLGDGINDAPALRAADLGIAMAEGTAIAQQSADLSLRENSLMGVLAALRLARLGVRTVRGNLFFALIYNVTAIPLAALGHLSPTLAAVAMSLSSLSVLLNALYLKKRLS